MTFILLSIIGILVLLLGFSTLFIYRLSSKIFELEEQIEESLDMLDGCYYRMSEMSKTPVLSDDQIVKDFISETKNSLNAILLIANKIMLFSGEQDGTNN